MLHISLLVQSRLNEAEVASFVSLVHALFLQDIISQKLLAFRKKIKICTF